MEDLNVVDSINHAGTWLARNQELLLSYDQITGTRGAGAQPPDAGA